MKSCHFQERGLIVRFKIFINFGRHLKIIWIKKIFIKKGRIPFLNPRVVPISLLIALLCLKKTANRNTLIQILQFKKKVRKRFLKSFSKYGPI